MGTQTKAKSAGKQVSDDVTTILDSIRRIVRVLRVASRAAEKEVGLTGAQLFVLHHLSESPAISLNELAARTRTHQSSVSVVVQRLVERGLVSRTRSGEDGRRVELSLTPASKSLVRKAPGAAQDRLIEALEHMPRADVRKLAELLTRLLDVTGIAEEEVEMFFADGTGLAASAAKPSRPPRTRRAEVNGRARRPSRRKAD